MADAEKEGNTGALHHYMWFGRYARLMNILLYQPTPECGPGRA